MWRVDRRVLRHLDWWFFLWLLDVFLILFGLVACSLSSFFFECIANSNLRGPQWGPQPTQHPNHPATIQRARTHDLQEVRNLRIACDLRRQGKRPCLWDGTCSLMKLQKKWLFSWQTRMTAPKKIFLTPCHFLILASQWTIFEVLETTCRKWKVRRTVARSVNGLITSTNITNN